MTPLEIISRKIIHNFPTADSGIKNKNRACSKLATSHITKKFLTG